MESGAPGRSHGYGCSTEITNELYPVTDEQRSAMTEPVFEAAAHHREAGLEGQLNIETTWIPVLRPKSDAPTDR